MRTLALVEEHLSRISLRKRDNLRLLRSHFELKLGTKKEIERLILDEELRKEMGMVECWRGEGINTVAPLSNLGTSQATPLKR